MYWKNQSTKKHFNFITGKPGLRGSARYCSKHAHLGHELSRRDDMISLCYTIAYLCLGELPWQKLQDKDGKNYHRGHHLDRIYMKKIEQKPKNLFDGYPDEFKNFMTYCENMSFTEQPEYMYWRKRFRALFKVCGYKWDFKYDWVKK